MSRIALFPGSFDPFTNGHLDVVRRGVTLFDEVIISIGNNSSKQRYLPVEQMITLIEQVFHDEPRVSVCSYKGLTADFAREIGARYLLRGLRNTTDFEYENTIAQANRHVNPELETVFLITSPRLAAINSTIIREIHRFGGNVDEFVPFPLPAAAKEQ
ncbi:pantetheine-phosphate adenylyltransferase [Hymenobacter taeanensis]|uniref:Phosphopantetheine adenylyltransferase n=1 Tax=Hymenobacter taeanensis TaxID=2735321 RepID=A0A6M6BB05_9BACT|nr:MULTISPECIES: pantetheine-phosphate adenylyltransferase [Hymenobacter]QJX45446.1 pantetheine-phosphate adenylyltransferase [Hymenobacter taeanensis]UOQ81308.1 pantetheine-phosphate adenylyltransferase [Hymenobacter sp. 5414T-23]